MIPTNTPQISKTWVDNFDKHVAIILTTVLYMIINFESIAQTANNTENRLPIIDMHMHTGLPHHVPEGMPAICRPAPCEGEGQATVNATELMKKTMQEMDKYNIVKGFLSGVDYSSVQAWKKEAPDKFLASPFILDVANTNFEELKQAYEAGKFSGMGEIGAQLMGVGPNDALLEPYFELAAKHDLPVLIHTLGIGPYMPHFSTSNGSPKLLEEVLKRHPKLRIFAENAGYPFRDEMIAMMYQYPQLYVDVSTITWVIPQLAFYDYLEALVRAGLGKRIMFGSDQMVWPEKIGEAVKAIENAPFLSNEQKRDIFYNNAARFLRLNGDEYNSLKH
ncbi:MAG: amidohydrolase family protein [Fulvivirga sp.]